ncbi:MAG TPA: hypothetical protein VN653_12805 [Anaerolineales bacterium]|nr:hypothetical protein [Anaerolineales bacterium]
MKKSMPVALAARDASKNYMLVILAVLLTLTALLFSRSVSTVHADESKVLEFNTLTGVQSPFTGPTNAIRGVPGGGAPWKIDFASGKLKPDGEVRVSVRGLVLVSSGVNPVSNMKVIVSCLSKDAAGNPVTVNVATATFPADAAGNAQFDDRVNLPQPCIAPILFVTSSGGAWLAATGS